MRRHLEQIFRAGVAVALPENCLPGALPNPSDSSNWVAGAGKAAASMARAVVESGFPVTSGVVVTRYGHGHDGADTSPIVVREAGHPAPDQAGVDAAGEILRLAQKAGTGDLFLFLASGGGSSLLTCPHKHLSLETVAAVSRALLTSGAPIGEINTVRRKLSQLAGGKLAIAAWPARVFVLAISDVPGDDPRVISSGPCHPDPDTAAQALDVMTRWHVDPGPEIKRFLSNFDEQAAAADHPVFQTLDWRIIARPADAVAAACRQASRLGYEVMNLGADLDGPARELGFRHGKLARDLAAQGKRVALISGGETTVEVSNPRGCGGRNSEYLLALGISTRGGGPIVGLAGDTDGIDGTGLNAGVYLDEGTLDRAGKSGLDPQACLSSNCSLKVFEASGDLFMTGPTRTNVNDLRLVLVSTD